MRARLGFTIAREQPYQSDDHQESHAGYAESIPAVSGQPRGAWHVRWGVRALARGVRQMHRGPSSRGTDSAESRRVQGKAVATKGPCAGIALYWTSTPYRDATSKIWKRRATSRDVSIRTRGGVMRVPTSSRLRVQWWDSRVEEGRHRRQRSLRARLGNPMEGSSRRECSLYSTRRHPEVRRGEGRRGGGALGQNEIKTGRRCRIYRRGRIQRQVCLQRQDSMSPRPHSGFP